MLDRLVSHVFFFLTLFFTVSQHGSARKIELKSRGWYTHFSVTRRVEGFAHVAQDDEVPQPQRLSSPQDRRSIPFSSAILSLSLLRRPAGGWQALKLNSRGVDARASLSRLVLFLCFPPLSQYTRTSDSLRFASM